MAVFLVEYFDSPWTIFPKLLILLDALGAEL